MEAQSLLRPAARGCIAHSISRSSPVLRLGAIQLDARRQKSTSARTKRALNIPPHPSFLSDHVPERDHIIFNPPSSSPSVFHTPFKFLPKSDPRRRANLGALFAQSTTIQYDTGDATLSDPRLSPSMKQHESRRYHLSKEDVAEIRRLRTSDPDKWHVLALAKKFECAPWFISMCCQVPKEKEERELAKLEKVKARWGARRTKAREDRTKRNEMLLRGDL